MLESKRILLAISGSIAAYKSAELISLLVKNGHDVKCIMTSSALNFVGASTIEGLTGAAPLIDDFESQKGMQHIDLGVWADMFIVAPATAQTINSLASGVGHSALLSTFLAYDLKKPLFIAPAMNTRMLEHPTTQASIVKLKTMSIQVLETDSGSLACGETGAGRMLEPQEIYQNISKYWNQKTSGRILITAGGTSIPIDSVRSITNSSTGATGAKLANFFSDKGYEVTLLTNKQSAQASSSTQTIHYETYDHLQNCLKTELSKNKYDYVFHAAAVSDYTVDSIQVNGEKLKSDEKISSGEKLELYLKPTEKILPQIKNWTDAKVIGFKLTDTKDVQKQLEAVKRIFSTGVDLVIHNDWQQITESNHSYTVYKPNLETTLVDGKDQLGPATYKVLMQQPIAEVQP